MKILVAVKRVVDPYVKIRLLPNGRGVDTQSLKMAMNPFDEIALEEALRLKEKGLVSEVVLLTIGTQASQETLRHGLALGADRALLIETPDSLVSIDLARVMAKIVLEESPHLVFMGKQAIDSDNNQCPQMLAGLLDWSQATFISEIQLESNTLIATREVDGGLETLKMQLPAVISADLRLNEPRYATLPNIMKAKQKPLQVRTIEELGLHLAKRSEVLSINPPKEREPGVKVQDVQELFSKLRDEARIFG